VFLPVFPVLTGNPVSSFVCFNLVTLPALRKMAGWSQPLLRRIQVSERGSERDTRHVPAKLVAAHISNKTCCLAMGRHMLFCPRLLIHCLTPGKP
jgi:molybdopterin biosynthesis enzyme